MRMIVRMGANRENHMENVEFDGDLHPGHAYSIIFMHIQEGVAADIRKNVRMCEMSYFTQFYCFLIVVYIVYILFLRPWSRTIFVYVHCTLHASGANRSDKQHTLP